MKLITAILLVLGLYSHTSFSQENVVTIPNIFTPNDDGDNDVFIIRNTEGYDALTCTIFNRYGEPVYRFYGLNGSWDGYSHAGIKVSAGVYFVLLEVSVDGEEPDTQQATLQVSY